MLEVGRHCDMPGDYAIAKPRRKTLDLRLDAPGHVERRALRYMAVGPGDVFPGRRARWVEYCRLREQHKRVLRMPPLQDALPGFGHLCKCAAEVDSACLAAFLRGPWNGGI